MKKVQFVEHVYARDIFIDSQDSEVAYLRAAQCDDEMEDTIGSGCMLEDFATVFDLPDNTSIAYSKQAAEYILEPLEKLNRELEKQIAEVAQIYDQLVEERERNKKSERGLNRRLTNETRRLNKMNDDLREDKEYQLQVLREEKGRYAKTLDQVENLSFTGRLKFLFTGNLYEK